MKKRLFLIISFLIDVISVVIILANIVDSTKESYEMALENDAYKDIREFWVWCVLGNGFTKGPIILLEISLIKNAYNLFIKKTFKIKKTFCLVSSVFTIIALILFCLGNNANFMYHIKQNYIELSWVMLAIAYVVGCVQIKTDDNHKTRA
jgi:hypothetical protein